MQSKTCTRCKVEKDLSLFYKRSRSSDGYNYYCKTCSSELNLPKYKETKKKYDFQRYHNGKETYRNGFYKRKYDITLEEYNTLAEKQNYACAICKSTCITGKNLAVDHDHKTGQVRGLLCANCNRALGLFKDSTNLLKEAFDYLKGKYAD